MSQYKDLLRKTTNLLEVMFPHHDALKRKAIGYFGAWTIGLFFGLIVLLLEATGHLKVVGRERLRDTTRHGGVTIMANHPSLLEAFLLPVILSPLHLFNLKYFFWSLPDEKLFESKSGIGGRLKLGLFRLGRCVTISRAEKVKNFSTIRQISSILEYGENLVVHPEAGRTQKGSEFVSHNGRRVRKITSQAARLAVRRDGIIVPVYVDKDEELLSIWGTFVSLFKGKQRPIVIYIGKPYKAAARAPATELNRQLEQKILTAGLP